MKKIFLTAALLCGTSALAHDYEIGDLTIDHPFSYSTAENAMVGAGYMVITNTGSDDDRLVSVDAYSERVELHNVIIDDNGVAKMVPQADGIVIPAGESVELKRGGYHVMFIGLGGDPFEVDEKVAATLHFENAGDLEVEFNVMDRSEASEMGGMHGHMDHSQMDHSQMDHGSMDHGKADGGADHSKMHHDHTETAPATDSN